MVSSKSPWILFTVVMLLRIGTLVATEEEAESTDKVGPKHLGCEAEFCDPNHEPYPNIVSVMTGYNILKGNPFTAGTTHDPGFSAGYIFTPTEKTDEDTYVLDGGITVRQVTRCNLQLSTETVRTVNDYRKKIEKSSSEGSGFQSNHEVEVSAEIVDGVGLSTTIPPIVDAAFSSSEEYNENVNFFAVNHGVLTFNDATCSTYSIHINSYKLPKFSGGFEVAIKALNGATGENADKKAEEFRFFMEQFGTHYIEKATLGARIAISRRYSNREFRDASESDIKSCNSKRLKFNLGFSIGGESASCEGTLEGSNSEKVEGFQREYLTTYGSRPASSLIEWSQQDFTSPLPIKMQLRPIIDLLQESHVKHLNIDSNELLKWMLPLYNTYCEDNKASLGIKECHPKEKTGCGWNDNCSPSTDICINDDTVSQGYKCCRKTCLSSPCENGGTCVDLIQRCSFRCECTDNYQGRTCADTVINKDEIIRQVNEHMSQHGDETNANYMQEIYRYLNGRFYGYNNFAVSVYNPVDSHEKHMYIGGNCVHSWNHARKNYVICWTDTGSQLPSENTKDFYTKRMLSTLKDSITNCNANEFAENAHGFSEAMYDPLAMILVVRESGTDFHTQFKPTTGDHVFYDCPGGRNHLVLFYGR